MMRKYRYMYMYVLHEMHLAGVHRVMFDTRPDKVDGTDGRNNSFRRLGITRKIKQAPMFLRHFVDYITLKGDKKGAVTTCSAMIEKLRNDGLDLR